MPGDEQAPVTGGAAAGDLLRARGLRVTPQRRAILGAFIGGATEHLSADEVHARASRAIPELGRGTVYATLAELTELGLLRAVGSPEPVRYETNVGAHSHFRCRLCLRLQDVALPTPATTALGAGFVVERVSVTAEGVCADCAEYALALAEGVRGIHAGGHAGPLPAGTACAEIDSPVGALALAATADGLVRVAYEEHADVEALREAIRGRRGGRRAREHLASAQSAIVGYFAGGIEPRELAVDWSALCSAGPSTLLATTAIGYGQDRSYQELRTDDPVRDRGLALGANPLAIVIPCHRVTRGREVPDDYIGGPERRRFLRAHERAHRAG